MARRDTAVDPVIAHASGSPGVIATENDLANAAEQSVEPVDYTSIVETDHGLSAFLSDISQFGFGRICLLYTSDAADE